MEEELEIKSLLDIVHRCLMCNSLAYATSDDEFECSECGFVWKVNSCGR